MSKKILLGLAAVLVVVGGVAALSAWEAHVINVTAHIENALYVHSGKIEFGTVFPQEFRTSNFTVELSTSFKTQDPVRAVDLDYEIIQKPKPILPVPGDCTSGATSTEAARKYCIRVPSDLKCCYRDLCRFLSKEDADPLDLNDKGVPSYFNATTSSCATPVPEIATGHLHKDTDPVDEWTVDLKVPPVAGFVGQDWPASCASWVVPDDAKDYGCDLWVEVTAISIQ